MMEDRFTGLAIQYARYRPIYPVRLGEYLFSLTDKHQAAWDCATGNGQVAAILSPYYKKIIATDISPGQISNALRKSNILYIVSEAERAPIAPAAVDLITVGQAIHWFDFDMFYPEVKRILKPGGIISCWGYSQPEIGPDIDPLCAAYFDEILGPYLPARLEIVQQHYSSLPFPFETITPPEFTMVSKWNLDHLLGMMASMSPVLAYQKEHGSHPVERIVEKLEEAWGPNETIRPVRWPLFFKIGRMS